MTQNRLFTSVYGRIADGTAILERVLRPIGRRPPAADPLQRIRWEKVRTIRAALIGGRYDTDARLDDLLDNPPEELARLARPRTIPRGE